MALDLLTTQKATIAVGLDDGAGNVTPLGAAFHFSFSTGKAELVATSTGFFVSAIAEGNDTLHISTLDGSVSTDVAITVSVDSSAPVPTLVVTLGTPEPK